VTDALMGIPAWTPPDPAQVADDLTGRGGPLNEDVRLAVRDVYGRMMRGKWYDAISEIESDIRSERYDRIAPLYNRISTWWNLISAIDGPLQGMPSRGEMLRLTEHVEREQKRVLQNLGTPPRAAAPIGFWSQGISEAMPPDGAVISDPGDYRESDILHYGKYPALVVYGTLDDLVETQGGIMRRASAYPFMRLLSGKLATASVDEVGMHAGVADSDLPRTPKPAGDLYPLPPRLYYVPVNVSAAKKPGAAFALARGLDSLGYADVGAQAKQASPPRTYSLLYRPVRVRWIKP